MLHRVLKCIYLHQYISILDSKSLLNRLTWKISKIREIAADIGSKGGVQDIHPPLHSIRFVPPNRFYLRHILETAEETIQSRVDGKPKPEENELWIYPRNTIQNDENALDNDIDNDEVLPNNQ